MQHAASNENELINDDKLHQNTSPTGISLYSLLILLIKLEIATVDTLL